MNQSQHKQILAVFWRQEYRSPEFRDIGDGQEVDVTAQVLSLDAEQIHAMVDDTDSTNDLVIAANLGHDGPHRIAVTNAICEYFGVDELPEITRQDLTEAHARHVKLSQTTVSERSLVVDGTDESGNFAGDANNAPFVVFDADQQRNIAGPFTDRLGAEKALHGERNKEFVFRERYPDAEGSYRSIREELLFISGSLRSVAPWGADFLNASSTRVQESMFLTDVLPFLEKHGFPAHRTEGMQTALREFQVAAANNGLRSQLLPEGWSMRETALSRAYYFQGGDAQVAVNKDKIDRGSMTIRVYGERTWSGYEGDTAGYVPLRAALTRAQETLADPSSHLSAYGVQMVEAGKAARDNARAAGWDQNPERGIYRVHGDQVQRVSNWGEALALDRELQQALPQTSRTEPDQLTLSYVAIGAHAAVRAAGGATPAHALDQFEGELGLIGAVSEKALMLDRVADWFDARDGHPGVFSYEVAEPFGTAYANALLSEGAEKDAAKILREVMQSAGYKPSEVEDAFVSELAARVDRRSARIDIPNVDAEAPQRPDVQVSPGGVRRNGPKSAFDAAIDALQLASECGGELDLPVYRDALKGLRKLRDGMLAYDQRLDDAESAPTGDDYNELLALSGLVMPAVERATLLNSRVALNTEDGETKPSASGPGF